MSPKVEGGRIMIGAIFFALIFYLLSHSLVPFGYRTVFDYKWVDVYYEEDPNCFKSYAYQSGMKVCFKKDGKLQRKYQEEYYVRLYLKHALAILSLVFFYGLLRYFELVDDVIGSLYQKLLSKRKEWAALNKNSKW